MMAARKRWTLSTRLQTSGSLSSFEKEPKNLLPPFYEGYQRRLQRCFNQPILGHKLSHGTEAKRRKDSSTRWAVAQSSRRGRSGNRAN
jgi:hypothetical protein